MNIFKAIALGSFLISWYYRATKDGKITQDEVNEMVLEAFQLIGFPITKFEGIENDSIQERRLQSSTSTDNVISTLKDRDDI